MNEVEKLIEKFWSGRLSRAEKVKLAELLNDDKGSIKQKLEEAYQRNLTTAGDQVTEKRFHNILEQLHLRIESAEQSAAPRTVSLFSPLKWIAALLIMTLGVGLLLYRKDEAPKPAIAAHTITKPISILQQQYNSGKEAMVIKLSDGSEVSLQPGSSVSYYKPFVRTSRNISMNGEVTFSVAKDKLHPFIVTAQGFTTTALGTKFTVNTKISDHVVIKLMEGKVVIRPAGKHIMEMDDIYLTPGQQLSINTRLKHPYVTTFGNGKATAIQKAAPVPAVPLVFKEDTLNYVFSKLAKQYKIQIRYEGIDPEEVKKLFFTGTFDPSESLNEILPAICNMNDLNFKRTSDTVIISKQK